MVYELNRAPKDRDFRCAPTGKGSIENALKKSRKYFDSPSESPAFKNIFSNSFGEKAIIHTTVVVFFQR